MTQRSVPESPVRHSRDSTRAVTTDRNLADQIAAVLLADRESIRKVFVGEPVMESMLMCAWALDHESEPGFDAARALTGWARKRQRGAWRQDAKAADAERAIREMDRDKKQRREECADCKGHFLVREMREAGEDHLTWYADDLLCKRCAKRNGAA